MNSHEKALGKSAGKEYKKGFTKGDLAAHKRENMRIKLHGSGEHSKVSFTPKSKSEASKFKKFFQN